MHAFVYERKEEKQTYKVYICINLSHNIRRLLGERVRKVIRQPCTNPPAVGGIGRVVYERRKRTRSKRHCDRTGKDKVSRLSL